jgi:hypothetical protein
MTASAEPVAWRYRIVIPNSSGPFEWMLSDSYPEHFASRFPTMREIEPLYAALSAAPVSAPDGVVVPREITLEMQKAYFDVIDRNMERVQNDLRFGRFDSNKQAYQAMIAAAPSVVARNEQKSPEEM